MILKKLGEDYYNGTTENVYLVYGFVTRDPEDKTKNKPHYKTSVALGQSADGKAQYLELDAWDAVATDLKGVRRGDRVLAVGKLKTREYEGKTYTSLELMWVGVSGAPLPTPELKAVGYHQTEPVFVPADDEDDDDGELPF